MGLASVISFGEFLFGRKALAFHLSRLACLIMVFRLCRYNFFAHTVFFSYKASLSSLSECQRSECLINFAICVKGCMWSTCSILALLYFLPTLIYFMFLIISGSTKFVITASLTLTLKGSMAFP